MSKWIMTKKKLLLLSVTLSLTLMLGINSYNNNIKYAEMNACLSTASHLPMNSPSHPCFKYKTSSNSWLAWVSGDSPSAYLHFLDLTELIQRTLH